MRKLGVPLLVVAFVAVAVWMAVKTRRHLPPKTPPRAAVQMPEVKPAMAPATQLACTTVGFRDGLRKFGESLAELPGIVDEGKWASVSEGAIEIQEKADALLAACGEIEQNLESLKLKDGELQKRLDEMVKEFENLAMQSQEDADGMPERLAIIAEREHATWIEGAKMVEAFKEYYTKLLDYYSRETGTLASVRPMLERMKAGSQLYAELAEVGEKLDGATATLSSFGKQLNEILNMFDVMSQTTERAIDEYADPSGTRLFDESAASLKAA